MVKGRFKKVGKYKYLLNDDGTAVTGAAMVGHKFYCFDKKGRLSKSKTTYLRKNAKTGKSFKTIKKLLGKPLHVTKEYGCGGGDYSYNYYYANGFYVYVDKVGKKLIYTFAEPGEWTG